MAKAKQGFLEYRVVSPDLRAGPLLLDQIMASKNSQLARLQRTDTYKSDYIQQNACQHTDLQMEQDVVWE